jgi:endoglucanase
MKKLLLILPFLVASVLSAQEALRFNEKGYLHKQGLDVTFFSDYYPEGHQSGVSVIQHGVRVAANGDLRLEPSPGQWDPVPGSGKRLTDPVTGEMTQYMWFPDTARNHRGTNPVDYPNLILHYRVRIRPGEDGGFTVIVDLYEPLPPEWAGRIGFNLELFPGVLFGKSFLMDGAAGLFPDQPAGPVGEHFGKVLGEPLAMGQTLVIAPEEDFQRMIIHSEGNPLELWDGRINHNNGWFIVRSIAESGVTEGAVRWTVKPHTVPGWKYEPVIQVSQLGYHPAQHKKAIVELDPSDNVEPQFEVFRLGENGREKIFTGHPVEWGNFLRYHYAILDFSKVTAEGAYQIRYGNRMSGSFRIAEDIYRHDTWQTTLEYYLPVQMCHMRVNEKYRVWHDLCHMDDALMAPPVPFHFDGYRQGEDNFTTYAPGDPVPGLNQGGWHDAGDFDLRVESQAGTVWKLAMMVEEFGLDYDATMIDFDRHLVEIHQPDGQSDALQQIEHGLLSILGGYRSLGRLYRGIICSDLRQYVMLGDAADMTDNLSPGKDDRWVFTEMNPYRVMQVVPALAAASRVLSATNPELAGESLRTAIALYDSAPEMERSQVPRVAALTELILSSGEQRYMEELISLKEEILRSIPRCGWSVGRVLEWIPDASFRDELAAAVGEYQDGLLKEQESDSPYGVPYKPNIWGAGWNIQSFGVDQYFFLKAWPGRTHPELMENALHFILGVHPGSNNASFVSGVGSNSVKVAYGLNRADWSYIPGGSVSGTALIRPDLPELKTWPFLWQQTEYVMGGGATNFMFLAMAVDALYNDQK